MFEKGDYLAVSPVPRMSVEPELPRRFRKADRTFRRRSSLEELRRLRGTLTQAKEVLEEGASTDVGPRARGPQGAAHQNLPREDAREKAVAYGPYVDTGWIEDRFLVM